MNHSYIDAYETKNYIVVWSRDKNGELVEEDYPLEDFLYAYMPNNSAKQTPMADLFGNQMKRVDFTNKWEFKDWCKTRTDLCESDVSPMYKVLLDRFSDAPTDAPYNVLFYDIEVDFDLEDGNGYPTPENPFGEINLFQMFDLSRKRYVIFLYDHLKDKVSLSDDEFPVELRFVSSERELLMEVAEYIEHIDVMAGWYTSGFDLPYIMERAIRIFGEKRALSLFCRNGYDAKKREFVNDYGQDVWEWTLVGRQHLDMQALYKKFIPGEKKSFSLDAVCEEDLGEKKHDFDGDLGELYRENPQEFCVYGKKDVYLLYKLNNKHQLIMLAMLLARINCVYARDVTGSVKPIETGFLKFCHERNIVLPDKQGKPKEDFPGAIVYDTISGLHKKMMTVDLTALYPSAMIMLGLSTETFVGQLKGGYLDYISVMNKEDKYVVFVLEDSKEEITVLASDLEQEIRENGFTISAFGSVFDGRLGLLSEYVQDRFNLRVHYQKLKKQAANDGNKELADTYDLFQKVIKIVCNSLYGCISNAHFRLFDIRLAKSITLTGQVISKYQAYKSNELLEQLKE